MCSAQRGWLPTALRLTSPAADRKEGARRAEGFGRATSGFLFSGLPWWQGAGGSTGHQRMSRLKTSVRVRKPGAKKPAQNVSCSLQPTSTITWTARAPRGGWTPRLCRGSAKTVQWPLLACPHDTPLIPQSSRCHGGLPEQAASLCVYRSTSTEPGTTQKISEQCGRTFLKMPREGKPHETGSFPAF